MSNLLPGESVVWEGKPVEGVRFQAIDIPRTVFGLFFTGISLIFVVSSFPLGLLLPHFWIGLYLVGGHYFFDAKARSHTSYALTQSRAIIVRRWPRYRLRTVNLLTVSEIGLTRSKDGTGTVTFGGQSFSGARMQFGNHGPPAFECISEVDEVMRLAHVASSQPKFG